MKKLLTILPAILLVAINLLIASYYSEKNLGGKDIATSTIDTFIGNLGQDQVNWFSSRPKYMSVDWTDVPQYELRYKVDEYDAPPYDQSGKGYQIYVERYDGWKKSYGVGVESSLYSYDWTFSGAVASSTQ